MLESQPGGEPGGVSNDDAATVMLGSKSPPEEGWRQRLAADVSAASVLIQVRLERQVSRAAAEVARGRCAAG